MPEIHPTAIVDDQVHALVCQSELFGHIGLLRRSLQQVDARLVAQPLRGNMAGKVVDAKDAAALCGISLDALEDALCLDIFCRGLRA